MLLLSTFAGLHAQVANDNFANATVLAGLDVSLTDTNTLATAESGEPAHAGTFARRSVWYRWTAPVTGSAGLTVVGTGFTPKVAVYTGDALAALSVVATKIGSGTTTFATTPGQTYRIVVDSNGRGGGPFSLGLLLASLVLSQPPVSTNLPAGQPVDIEYMDLEPGSVLANLEIFANSNSLGVLTAAPYRVSWTNSQPGSFPVWAVATNSLNERRVSATTQFTFRPGNDNFADAYVIEGTTTSAEFVTDPALATIEPPEPPGGADGRSVWWRWTPVFPASVTIEAGPSVGGIYVAVYTGQSLETLAKRLTVYSGSNPARTLEIEPGSTYHFQVVRQTGMGLQGNVSWSLHQNTLELDQPANGSLIPAGAPVVFSVTNQETLHPYSQVEFRVNSTPVGVVTGPPYEFTWNTMVEGVYTVEASGTNDLGIARHTEVRTFTVGPANDTFARATVIPGDSADARFETSFANALNEPGEPSVARLDPVRTLWWRWTPAYDGLARLTTANEGAGRPTAVFTGEHLTNLTVVIDNAVDWGQWPTNLTFEVVAGTTYHIVINNPFANTSEIDTLTLSLDPLVIRPANGSRFLVGEPVPLEVVVTRPDLVLESCELRLEGAAWASFAAPPYALEFVTNTPGTYHFSAQGTNADGRVFEPSPRFLRLAQTNDDLAHAGEVAWVDGYWEAAGHTGGATYETAEPLHDGINHGTGSQWYVWTSPFSGTVVVESVPSFGEPIVAVYTGEAMDGLTGVAHTEYGQRRLNLPVTAGTTYRIAVDNYWANGPHVLSVWPPPANDAFAQAIEQSGTQTTFRGLNHAATVEEGEPNSVPPGVGSIWWKWTAPATGLVTLDSGGTAFDCQLGVYTGADPAHLQAIQDVRPTSIDPHPDYYGGWSPLFFRVHQGITYYILQNGITHVTGRAYGVAQVNLALNTSPGLPANDDFSERIRLTGLTNVVETDNRFATRQPGEPGYNGSEGGRSLWWEYEASEPGTLRVEVYSGDYWSILGVFQGDSVNRLTPLATGLGAPIRAQLEAGDRVGIMVDCWLGASGNFWGGPLTLSVVFMPRPTNDDFAGASRILDASSRVTGYTYGATREVGEPLHGGGGSHTVWYSWAAPSTATVTLDVRECPPVAVYTGPTLDRLKPVRMSWLNAPAFGAVEGTVYHFAFESDTPGEFSFELKPVPIPKAANDDFAAATPLMGGYVQVVGSLLGAGQEPGEPTHLFSGDVHSVWFRWAAGFRGQVGVSTEGSLVGGLGVAVYRGDSVDALQQVAAGHGATSFAAEEGVVYHIVIVAPEDAPPGQIWLTLMQTPAPGAKDAPLGNIVRNPSFEGEASDGWDEWARWEYNMIGISVGYVGEGFLAGRVMAGIGGGFALWQDVETVPGRTYRLRLAHCPTRLGEPVLLRLWLGSQLVGEIDYTNTNFGYQGQFSSFQVTATEATSRVRIESLGYECLVDQITLDWIEEPPGIVAWPRDLSTFEGGAAKFAVSAQGSLPLAYQWYHGDDAVPGGTNRTLILSDVTPANAGNYRVVVTNRFGQATSATAVLAVEKAEAPVFVLQPAGDQMVTGQRYTLAAAVAGTKPIACQWFRDGAPLNGATNCQLIFDPVALADAGTYTVMATNTAGQVTSLPATLRVVPSTSPGTQLWLVNSFLEDGPHDALIYDMDGVTPLAGEAFLAQLYAGPTAATLRPVGRPTPFGTGFNAGLVEPVLAFVPNVAPGERVFLQVCCWERRAGVSYEEARALGGRFGRSEIVEAVIRENHDPLAGLKSFGLQAGIPGFTTGRLVASDRQPDGRVEWVLQGTAGFRYLVERSEDGFNWQPLLLLTAEDGTARFVDTAVGARAFYRSRLLN